MELKEQKN